MPSEIWDLLSWTVIFLTPIACIKTLLAQSDFIFLFSFQNLLDAKGKQ